ncbi:MAG: hypothetical protein KGI80_02100 [Verrucomicrobiota bacterium]|nr:hypothetical protein [Verrucomicrobiota bacterium]
MNTTIDLSNNVERSLQVGDLVGARTNNSATDDIALEERIAGVVDRALGSFQTDSFQDASFFCSGRIIQWTLLADLNQPIPNLMQLFLDSSPRLQRPILHALITKAYYQSTAESVPVLVQFQAFDLARKVIEKVTYSACWDLMRDRLSYKVIIAMALTGSSKEELWATICQMHQKDLFLELVIDVLLSLPHRTADCVNLASKIEHGQRRCEAWNSILQQMIRTGCSLQDCLNVIQEERESKRRIQLLQYAAARMAAEGYGIDTILSLEQEIKKIDPSYNLWESLDVILEMVHSPRSTDELLFVLQKITRGLVRRLALHHIFPRMLCNGSSRGDFQRILDQSTPEDGFSDMGHIKDTADACSIRLVSITDEVKKKRGQGCCGEIGAFVQLLQEVKNASWRIHAMKEMVQVMVAEGSTTKDLLHLATMADDATSVNTGGKLNKNDVLKNIACAMASASCNISDIVVIVSKMYLNEVFVSEIVLAMVSARRSVDEILTFLHASTQNLDLHLLSKTIACAMTQAGYEKSEVLRVFTEF